MGHGGAKKRLALRIMALAKTSVYSVKIHLFEVFIPQ
jgi:hypothetical protein